MVESYEFFLPKRPVGMVRMPDGTKYTSEPVYRKRKSDKKEVPIGGSFLVENEAHFEHCWENGLRGVPKESKAPSKKPKWDKPADTTSE